MAQLVFKPVVWTASILKMGFNPIRQNENITFEIGITGTGTDVAL
jgi:hypothetical protein